MRRAPRRMAVGGAKGMPRTKRGMKAAWHAELLADSGPATPSMAPLPNSSGCLEMFLSIMYDEYVAITGAGPGTRPTPNPTAVPLKMDLIDLFKSSRDG